MNCNLTIFLVRANEPLGRHDSQSMSDQCAMELLTKKLYTNAQFRDERGEYLDVCNWDGIVCDEEHSVKEILIHGAVEGTLMLDYIPRRIKKLDISHCFTYAELSTEAMPSSIEIFKFVSSGLCGEVDMALLPKNLTNFSILLNKCTGTLDLTSLPSTLEHCILSMNQFFGNVRLDKLPESLQCLAINDNKLQGTLNFDGLPKELKELYIHANAFCGSFVLLHPPQKLVKLNASQNFFGGTIVIKASAVGRVYLAQNPFTDAIDENGNRS